MKVKLLLFAGLRERKRSDHLWLELSPGATVADLLNQAEQDPEIGPWVRVCRVAVDRQFAAPGDPLPEGAELALLPPVSGGHDGPRCSLSETPLSLDDTLASIRDLGCGGIVVFIGQVRRQSQGKTIAQLEYESYGPMALRVLQDIAAATEATRPGCKVAITHRLGRLQPGELAVIIAVSAPHRDAAFSGCREVIERLKQEVPIWKRETSEDGVEWVGLGP